MPTSLVVSSDEPSQSSLVENVNYIPLPSTLCNRQNHPYFENVASVSKFFGMVEVGGQTTPQSKHDATRVQKIISMELV